MVVAYCRPYRPRKRPLKWIHSMCISLIDFHSRDHLKFLVNCFCFAVGRPSMYSFGLSVRMYVCLWRVHFQIVYEHKKCTFRFSSLPSSGLTFIVFCGVIFRNQRVHQHCRFSGLFVLVCAIIVCRMSGAYFD